MGWGLSTEGWQVWESLAARQQGWVCRVPDSVRLPPVLELPSAHPTLVAPLVVTMGDRLEVEWYGCSFWCPCCATGNVAHDCVAKIDGLVEERLLHAVAFAGDKVVGVGLVASTDWTWWHANYDRIELRSWRGSFDADVIADQDALDHFDWAI